jgi:hypothetical protein
MVHPGAEDIQKGAKSYGHGSRLTWTVFFFLKRWTPEK